MVQLSDALGNIMLPEIASLRIELRYLSLELGISRIGITAVAVFHPLGALEEKPHFPVVATVGEVLYNVNQFVRLVVLAVPCYRG